MTESGSIIKRVLQTIRRYRLIDDGDRILVGLSGGPDSTALLHILHRLQDKLNVALSAVYINHLLRPAAAKKETAFCRKFCDRLTVPFLFEEADVPKLAAEARSGVEETARMIRYEIFDRLLTRGGFAKIAVGHHRDDRAETVLFNLFRGAGRQGAVGLAPRRDKVIRPLYDMGRDDIMNYVEESRLEYITDASNRSAKFTRNRIRSRVIPVIKREVSEAAMDNVIRFSDILADEEAYLREITLAAYKKVELRTPGGKFSLDLGGNLEYDIWLRRRLIMQLLADAGVFDIEYMEVGRIVDFVTSGRQSRISIRKEIVAETAGGRLYVYHPGRRIGVHKVGIPGRYRLEYPRVCFRFEFAGGQDVKGKKSGGSVARVDADKLEGDLYVAGLKPGARFHPFGRPGSKKVSDFLTDQKYPRPLRDELPILYDERGVVWVAGLEIDHRVRVQSTTRKIAEIEIETY